MGRRRDHRPPGRSGGAHRFRPAADGAALLDVIAAGERGCGYAHRLLTAFGDAAAPATVAQSLVDPLSQCELDVLRLLRSDLAGPGTACQLAFSLNTVRTHTRNVYAKLGVDNRRSAVCRAGELALLE